ncbi:MAG: rhodanese-related sulfurtransferase [Janthinobacterium lividum]
MSYTVAAFYRFTPLADASACHDAYKLAFAPLGLCGTLLVAPEGINGTIAGSPDAIETILSILREQTGLLPQEVKFSSVQDKPFNRLKIRLKREIITFNQPTANPSLLPGTYVVPKDWNRLLDDPEVSVLDTRNLYETAIGKFANASDPQIENFTDLAAYVRSKLDPAKNKKIAMYCTGGIRCEKASAFMRAEGFHEVYHLQGGILKYLEEVPESESRWQGDCYVFDKRMAVGHGLSTGKYSMCSCCGYPLSADDLMHPIYEAGVSCVYCHGQTSNADKARFRERQRQVSASNTAVSESRGVTPSVVKTAPLK